MLRADPYRLFFPLGWLLAVAGLVAVLPAAAELPGPAGLRFHSIAMLEGFVTAFAYGFLFTFVPRRTGTDAPRAWQLAAAAVAVIAAPAAAAAGRFAWAHAAWACGVVVVVQFALSRLARSGAARRVPGAFVWVPVGLCAGLVGAVLAAVALGRTLPQWAAPEVWALGRALLLQGLIPPLVIGVGTILVPQLTRGIAAPPTFDAATLRRGRVLHGIAALVFVATFPAEIYVDSRAALTLRATVVYAVLIAAARIDRLPTVPGLHRTLLWISAWLLPSGWLLAALAPRLRGPALHLVFLGGFALMVLSISFHVILSHGGHPERLSRTPPLLRAMAGLVALALAARLLVGVDPEDGPAWISAAAALLLAALAAWAALVVPGLRGQGTGGQ